MSEAARRPGRALRIVLGMAAVMVVLAGLRAGAPLLVPIALALFLAVLALPIFQGLLARRVPVGLAIAVTFVVLLAAIAVFGVLLLGSLGELRQVAPGYVTTLQERISYTAEWWQEKGIAVEEWIPPTWRRPERAAELLGGVLRTTAVLLSEITLILLLLVFLLGEAASFERKLERLPASVREPLVELAHVSRELQRYLSVKTFMSATIGVSCAAWVAFLDVDFAVLCGLIAFGFHFVPNIGAILAAAPAMLVAFIQYDLTKSFAVVVGYTLIALVLGNLVEPALLGRRLGLSTLTVFVSLLVWGWLWGAVGMFLSVPLTMAFKMMMARSSDWRWVATLLEPAPRPQAPPRNEVATEAGPSENGA